MLSTSQIKPINLESDRGAEFYNNLFQNFLKTKDIQHYSRFTDKGPSKAERVIRTVRNLLRKPVFLKGNADWIFEILSVIKKYNNTIHSSIKMTCIQTSKKETKKQYFTISKILEKKKDQNLNQDSWLKQLISKNFQ